MSPARRLSVRRVETRGWYTKSAYADSETGAVKSDAFRGRSGPNPRRRVSYTSRALQCDGQVHEACLDTSELRDRGHPFVPLHSVRYTHLIGALDTMTNDKLRLGILGTSWWTDVVWPGFAQAGNAEVRWIAARTATKAEAFASSHGIPHWSGSYDEVIAAPDVDAVFLGVPNFMHHDIAIAALSAGKHVFQEKPMALSSAEALAQSRLAGDRGLVLSVNQEVRWADGVRDLPAAVLEGVGQLRKLHIALTLAAGEWGGWRGDPSLSGGTLFEMVIHQLDLARWLWQRDPVAVIALGEDVAGRDMTVVLDFGAGDSAIIDVCWRSIRFRLSVACTGERGTLTREYEMPAGGGISTLLTA